MLFDRAALTLSLLLAASGPSALAADFSHPPDAPAFVHRQPQAPATDEAPSSPRQKAQPSAEDDAGRIVGGSILSTLVMIGVGAVVCVFTGVCIVTM